MLKREMKDLTLPLGNAVFIILCLVYLTGIFSYPYIGLALENQEGIWTVVYSDPYGEGAHSGIRKGDIVLQMDGLAPAMLPSVREWGEAENVSELMVQTPGEVARSVRIVNLPYRKTLFSELPLLAVGVCFWLIGLNAAVKRPVLQAAQALFRLNCLVGLLFIITPVSSRGLFLAKELMFTGLSLAPLFLLHFIAVLLKLEQQKSYSVMIRLLLIFPGLIILTILGKWAGLIDGVSQLRAMSLANGVIGFGAAFALLFRLRGLPDAQPEKNQITLMLAGLIVSLLPFLAFTAVPILAGREPVLYSKLTTLFIVILPFTMSYIVINQYLPDSRKLLKDILTYLIAGIAASLVLYGFLYASGVLSGNDVDSYLSLLALTTGNIVLFFGLKFMGSKMWDRLDSGKNSKLKETWAESTKALQPDDESAVLEDLTCQFKLEGALVLIAESGGACLQKACGKYDGNQREQQVLEDYYLKTFNTVNAGQVLPRTFPAEVYFPFVSGNFRCGLFLGYRRSHIAITAQEIPWMSAIVYQACQRLKSIYTVKSFAEKLNTAEKKLEEFHRERHLVSLFKRWLFKNFEEEKKILAREIHDGPLQSGLYLNRKLKELKQSSVETADADTFSGMQELMENLNYDLRTICSKLRPSALKDLGLLPALEAYIQETMRKELITITLEVMGLSWEERWEEDIELAIFRFLQEGIRNVVKHSGASQAKITLIQKSGEIHAEIKDEGRGFDPAIIQENLQEELLAGGQFGLIGMKERIESLGGASP